MVMLLQDYFRPADGAGLLVRIHSMGAIPWWPPWNGKRLEPQNAIPGMRFPEWNSDMECDRTGIGLRSSMKKFACFE
ncbi:hypothetical protein BWI97_23235 [Siphonobacter sp. BAB-5405]|nr:hypothetical protein BWI97_23235 [Siphonobacter sp. BAB-5405]